MNNAWSGGLRKTDWLNPKVTKVEDGAVIQVMILVNEDSFGRISNVKLKMPSNQAGSPKYKISM